MTAAERIRALLVDAEAYRGKGSYPEAEQSYRAALALAEASFGERLSRLPKSQTSWARAPQVQRRFRRGRAPLPPRAGDLGERLGSDVPEVATIYHNMGGVEHARGDFAQAEPLARRSVAIREQVEGDDLDLAADRAALAAILDGCGKTAEAGTLLRAALAVFTRRLGSEHHEVAVTLNNLAAIAHRGGEAQEAESLYRRALAIKERAIGPQQPELAPTLNNLALLCAEDGRCDEAGLLYQRAIALLEGAVAPDHPTLVACRDNHAALPPCTCDPPGGGWGSRKGNV